MSDILVVIESRAGQIKKASLEAIGEARRLASEAKSRAAALVLGGAAPANVADLGLYGADLVLLAEDPRLEPYCAGAYARTVADVATQRGFDTILLGATAFGKDLGAHAAARLGAGMISDCVSLAWESGALTGRRPVYAGKAFATVKVTSSVRVATLRPNLFPIRKTGKAVPPEKIAVDLAPADLRAVTRERVAAGAGKKDLTEAEIVVSGGRGLKAPDNFKLIEELAAALGGVSGASRAIVDAGWRPHSEQVGQTGKTVSPTLYVACGISGAIQHLAGISSSKVIVAINTDKDAPIFKVADYGIVGDAMTTLPALIQEIKKVRSSDLGSVRE